jgi:hypothetical protein
MRRSPQIRASVGGTGDEAFGPQWSRPTAATQMNPRTQCGGEPCIAGHDQDQPARPANPREVAAETRPIRMIVMPEHDSGEAAR